MSVLATLPFLLAGACSSSASKGAAPDAIAASTTESGASTTPTTRTSPTTRATSTSTARSPIACVDALPIRERVGQMIMSAVVGPLDAATATFADLGLGGALLEAPSAEISSASVVPFRDAGRIPLFVAVDEEGGEVQRLDRSTGTIPSETYVANAMTVGQAGALIGAHARKVAALGVNVVFAPVADVKPVGRSAPIGTRAFGDDPQTVTRYTAAYVAAWQGAGVMPVMKHFPGFGSATGNTDSRPATVPPLAALRQRDLVPYDVIARGAKHLGVMVTHVQVPNFSGGPASLSPAVYALLRNDVGFGGVVFTDALGAGAITASYSITNAAVAALAAGADVALIMDVGGAPSVLSAAVAAVGKQITVAHVDAAVARILAAKQVDPCSLHG